MPFNTTFTSYKSQSLSKQEKTSEKKETKNSLFELLLILIQYSPITKRFEILSAMIQSIQLISYAFESKFEASWKSAFLFPIFNKLFIYFKLIPFFKYHISSYLIAYYTTILAVLIITLLILILFIQQKNRKVRYIELAQGVAVVLALTTSFFFIAITETLISIFEACFIEGALLEHFKTKGDFVHITLGTISLVIFLFISFVVINTVYDFKYKGSPYVTKKSLKNDNVFFFNKCLIILSNCVMKYTHMTVHLLAIICFFLFYQTYLYFTVKCFYSFVLQKTYLTSSLLLSWTFLILLLNEITFTYYILGSIPAFWFIGVCLILIGCIFIRKRFDCELLIKDSAQITNADVLIKQVEEIIDLLYSKKQHRRSRIFLFGYINSYNFRSIDNNKNSLKNYFTSLNEAKNINFFILHINDLLKHGLAKFPLSARLRIYYSIFIYENLYKREQALKELEYSAGRYSLSLSEKFLVYRLKREILIQLYPQLGDSLSLNLSNKESNITYKTLLAEFRSLISKSSYEYTEFWMILSNSHGHGSHPQHLTKLNSIGIQIKKEVDSIHSIYDQLTQLKPGDQDVILDYWYFVTNILNDEDKSILLLNQIKDIVSLTQTINEENLCHIDLKRIYVNDDYSFIIFSAMPKSLGRITHISIKLSSFFGYNQEELLGKPIEKLLPEIYSQAHQRYLTNIVNYYKSRLYDDYSFFQNFKIQFKDQLTYVVNKSKYLLPVNSKATFFPNEDGKQYFYMKISNDNSFTSFHSKHHICFVLTDLNLLIQNFTANAANLLGLHSGYICSSNQITAHIRQLHEDYLKTMVDLENERKSVSKETALLIKHKLIKMKYAFPTPITWLDVDKKENCADEHSKSNSNNQCEESSTYMFLSEKNPSNKPKKPHYNPENYILTVHDYGQVGDMQGFIFQFEPIASYNIRNSSFSPSSKAMLPTFEMREDRRRSIFQMNNESNNRFDLNKLKVGSTGFSSANTFKINKKYIPELSFQFALDPTDNSFFQTLKVNKQQLLDQIKSKAEAKTLHNTERSNNEDNSSKSLSNNPSSDTSEGSSSFSSSADSAYSLPVKQSVISSSLTDNNCNSNYFHVNVSNIKYYVYDFSKRVIKEHPLPSKQSEVEVKLSKEAPPFEENKVFIPTQSSKRLITMSKADKQANEQFDYALAFNKQLNDSALLSKREKVKQEIKKALKRDTIQSTVIALYFLSAIAFVLVIAKELIFLMHYLTMTDHIIDYVILIRDSFRLHRNIILTMFSLRELTLISTKLYLIPEGSSEEEYINIYYGYLSLYFEENDIIVKNITISSISFPSEMTAELNEIASSNCFINNTKDYNLNCFNNTFISSINAINSALHTVATTNFTEVIPTNADIFYYLYNGMNSVWLGVEKFNAFCIVLFEEMSKNTIWKLCLIFIGCELILLMVYFIARKGLIDATVQNDSYLTIFFAISKEDIMCLLNKCEKFTNHFQNNKIKEKYFKKEMHKNDEEIDNDNDNDNDSVATKDTTKYNKEQQRIRITRRETSLNSSKTLKQDVFPKQGKRKNNCGGLFFFGHAFLISGALGVFVFDCVLLSEKINFTKQNNLSINIYESQARLHRQTLFFFNLLRESCFDKNAFFQSSPLSDYIDDEIVNIYNKIRKEREKIKESIQDLSDTIYSYYFTINSESLCPSAEDPMRCINDTDNSASYGLENLVMFYIEEIRALYYTNVNTDLMHRKFHFKYNYTLSGTDKYNAFFPTNQAFKEMYLRVSPMESIFNSDIHQKIVYMYWSLINPSYNKLTVFLGDDIVNKCESQRQYYIISFGIMMGIILFLVFVIWFPFLNFLSTNIYKTKNMLSIVSMEILASIENINRLLGINLDIDLFDVNMFPQ